MILDCPACGARYRLPDDAIPAAGKTVRCARCKHSWVELGEPLDDEPAGSVAGPLAAPIRPGTAPPAPEHGAEASAAASLDSAPNVAAVSSTAGTAIADTPPATEWEPDLPAPRRRRWLWLLPLLMLIALALGAAAVVTRIVAPPAFVTTRVDVPKLTLPALTVPVVDLPPLDVTRIPYVGPWLDRRLNPPALPPVVMTLQADAEFHQLGNGSRMLALTGSVANPSGSQQAVPEIEALLLDAARRPVYRWRIPAPLVALPPRSSAAFDSSASGYPASGTTVTLRFVREP